MTYNSNIHHRRSIRLRGYDYAQAGLYFVTICVQNRECLFGDITNGEMVLNDAGKMTTQCWLTIPQHFPHAVLHEYVVMPNHVHGIIELTATVGAKNILPLSPPNDATIAGAKNFSPLRRGTSRTIGSIIRGFKIGVTKQLGYSIWQRNYHEHIIRNPQSHQRIAEYIINNPANWAKDTFRTN